MSFYGSKMAGFGYAGRGIVGDIGFDSQYADTFWRLGGLGATYSPPSSNLLDAAAQQWQHLQELIDLGAPSSARAKARLKQLRDDLGYYVSTIEGWVTQRYDFAHESADRFVQMNVVRVYNGINAKLRSFADEAWPDAYEEIAAAEVAAKAAADAKKAADAQAAAAAAAAAAKLQQTQEAAAAAQAAIDAANAAKAVAQASAQKNKELQALSVQRSAAMTGRVPWLIGGLAVLTAGAVFIARKGKSSKTAGYRRRR